MKLISVNHDIIQRFKQDRQMLHKYGRPCVLVMRLKYKGKRQSFAVPLRSNIPAAAPKSQYFPLPPRPTTKPKNRHGLHYIKMFPIDKSSYTRYRTEGNTFSSMVLNILSKNEKRIISDCQKYLSDYENGIKPKFCTDIDFLLTLL